MLQNRRETVSLRHLQDLQGYISFYQCIGKNESNFIFCHIKKFFLTQTDNSLSVFTSNILVYASLAIRPQES